MKLKQSDLDFRLFVINEDRYEAIRYLPTYIISNLITMISLKHPKEKEISKLGNMFDIYCWHALFFSLLLTAFIISKITTKSSIKGFIIITLSLLESMLRNTGKNFINHYEGN